MHKKLVALLIIGISFSINSCQKESLPTENDGLSKIAQSFELSQIKTPFTYEFNVNWNSQIHGYSDLLNSEITEYNLTWATDFNPNNRSSSRNKFNVRETFKLIAKKTNDDYSFYFIKFKYDANKPLPTFSSLDSYSGSLYFYKEDGTIKLKKEFNSGIKISTAFLIYHSKIRASIQTAH